MKVSSIRGRGKREEGGGKRAAGGIGKNIKQHLSK